MYMDPWSLYRRCSGGVKILDRLIVYVHYHALSAACKNFLRPVDVR